MRMARGPDLPGPRPGLEQMYTTGEIAADRSSACEEAGLRHTRHLRLLESGRADHRLPRPIMVNAALAKTYYM